MFQALLQFWFIKRSASSALVKCRLLPFHVNLNVTGKASVYLTLHCREGTTLHVVPSSRSGTPSSSPLVPWSHRGILTAFVHPISLLGSPLQLSIPSCGQTASGSGSIRVWAADPHSASGLTYGVSVQFQTRPRGLSTAPCSELF